MPKLAGCQISRREVGSGSCERPKKTLLIGEFETIGHSVTSLQDQLRNLCAQDGNCLGERSGESSNAQAQYLLALADELGFLIRSEFSWSEFHGSIPDELRGSEHVVDFNHTVGLVGKITIPPGFGLTPFLHQVETAHADPSSPKEFRDLIEFRIATPLEYLKRWSACNEVFGDDVRVASVILWEDGLVSICTIQPQYPGERADQRDIRKYFKENGWQHIKDASGHEIFYHYACQIMAIDAVGRNCFIDSQGIQPFDVILCSPDSELEKFLNIYPH